MGVRDKLWKCIDDNWEGLVKVRAPVAAIGLLALVGGWTGGYFYFKDRIDGLNERIDGLKDDLAKKPPVEKVYVSDPAQADEIARLRRELKSATAVAPAVKTKAPALFEGFRNQTFKNNRFTNLGDRQIAKNGEKLDVSGNEIGTDSPSRPLPPADGRLISYSNNQVAAAAVSLANEMANYGKSSRKLPPEIIEKYYDEHFAKLARELASEMEARIPGGIQVPADGKPDPGAIRSGKASLSSGVLSGIDPLPAQANFLLHAVRQVNALPRSK